MSRPVTRRPGVLAALLCAASLAACTGNGDGPPAAPSAPPAVAPSAASHDCLGDLSKLAAAA